jgi:hypothetical protein
MNAPFQIDMFGTVTPSSSPIGLSVILPKPCGNCGSAAAVVESSRGPHHASLLCDRCGGHRGWLSGTTYRFLSGVIENFGRPSEPIEIRHNQSVPTTDATAQAVTVTALTTKGSVTAGKAHGIGFCLTGTNIAAVDADKCRDPVSGAIDAWAQKLLDAAPDTYVETTVSGTGLRIIGTANGPDTHRRFNIAGRKGAGVEVYRHATRYITISGLEQGHCNEFINIDALIDGIVTQHDVADNTEKAKTTNDDSNGFDDIDNLIRNGAPETQRSEAFARCVWSLAGCGLGADEIEEELRRYPNGIMAKYAKRLRREIDRCYAKWQAKQTAGDTSSPHNWDDPDMSILDDRRGDLPNFPTDIFAPTIREWLERAAHGAGVFPDHVAVPMLGVVASLIGTARRVRASRSWSEPITLWTALVAPRAIARPLVST